MISSQAYRPSRSIFIGVYTRLAPRAGFNEGLLSLGKHGCNSYCTKRLLTSNAKPGTSTNHGLSSEKGNGVEKSTLSQLWSRFIGPKEMPPRWTPRWYSEMVLICTVFGITGSSTMILVRPAVSTGLGLEGNMKDGPWSYRICSLVVMTPIYATLLVVIGTLFGRHHYFRHFSVKMWSRFGIPPEMIDASYHETKKTFRKW